MRGKTANAQNKQQTNRTNKSLAASDTSDKGFGSGGGATFSFKLLIHKLSLENELSKDLGTKKTLEIGFALKLLDYPTIQVNEPLKASKDQLISTKGQPRFMDLNIGKAWVFTADKETLLSKTEIGHVGLSVITLSGKELGVAKLALQSFKRFLQEPQREDNYRRKTFTLFRQDLETHTGQIELSLSFTCIAEDKTQGARASRLLLANQPKGFFDESNNSSYTGMAVPQLREHLTASMLSRNEFADDVVTGTVEKSAVEAILESKKSRNFFEDSEDKSKASPVRPTVKQASKQPQVQQPSIQLAASASIASTMKGKESKPKSQVKFTQKPVLPVEAARVELPEGGPSVLRPFEAQNYESLGNQLKELSKMPGIHEMASQSMYCPPPLFYHKTASVTQGLTTAEGFGEPMRFGERPTATQGFVQAEQPPLQQNFFLKADDQTPNPQVLRPTIVLNERATRSLLSETDLQLAMGQNTLLDLVLAEIVRLKTQNAPASGKAQLQPSQTSNAASPLVRVLLENPQALLGGLQRSASGSDYVTSGAHHPGVSSPKQSPNKKPAQVMANKSNGAVIANNESLKDSIFQQSQGKKGDRRRDLEKIEEHADSKYYDDDFDQIKDDVQMSLSISQTAPYQQGAKPGANPGQQKNNGSLKKKGTFEDESGPGDFDSQSLVIDPLRGSESAGQLGSRRKGSNVLQPKEQESGPTIQCFNCRKTIFVKDVSDHFTTCLKPELQSKAEQEKKNTKVQKPAAKTPSQPAKPANKQGGQASPNMKASASYDPYAASFADADQMQMSASKSSILRKSDKEMIQRSESRVKTDYDDEFIDPGTERSELPDF